MAASIIEAAETVPVAAVIFERHEASSALVAARPAKSRNWRSMKASSDRNGGSAHADCAEAAPVPAPFVAATENR